MRWCLLLVPVASAFWISHASAQVTAGAISGSVTDAEGRAVSTFPIQAINNATKMAFSATPSQKGEYQLGPLPAGTYQILVQTPRILFLPFSRGDVTVAAGQNVSLDIHLEEGFALNTAGDGRDFYLDSAKGLPAPPIGTSPRTASGKPDFSGLWMGDATVEAEKPELLPAAQAVWKERLDNNLRDLPSSACLPLGITLASVSLHRIIQTPNLVVILYEGDLPGFRQIPIDGGKLPEGLEPTWMGRSTARWDGDTLVVESSGFNDKTWLDIDAHPHTAQMRVTERIRRLDLGHLETKVTIDDPAAYLHPWTSRKVSRLAPAGEEIRESICTENNRDVMHMVGK